MPVLESALQLEATPAHVAQVFSQQAQSGTGIDRSTCLLNLLLIDQNLPCQNERLCAFP
jgi:hypothetical protein